MTQITTQLGHLCEDFHLLIPTASVSFPPPSPTPPFITEIYINEPIHYTIGSTSMTQITQRYTNDQITTQLGHLCEDFRPFRAASVSAPPPFPTPPSPGNNNFYMYDPNHYINEPNHYINDPNHHVNDPNHYAIGSFVQRFSFTCSRSFFLRSPTLPDATFEFSCLLMTIIKLIPQSFSTLRFAPSLSGMGGLRASAA